MPAPAAFVIAQQYSSAHFVLLRFHSRLEKKNSAHFKKCLFFLFFKNYVSLKLRNFKLRETSCFFFAQF